MAEDQLLLLPKQDYFEWVEAAREYVLKFGPNLTPDLVLAARAKTVTAPNGQGLFTVGDLQEWFRQHSPQTRLDWVPAVNPEEWAVELGKRVRAGARYAAEERPITLAWPTDYNKVLQEFGANPDYYRRWGLPGHEGLDIRAPFDTNVYACAEGVVSVVHDGRDNHPYGIHVRIRHRDGYQTIYGHLAEALVKEGDPVAARQQIGRADSTGNTSSSHLHLTVKKEGATAAGLTPYPRDIIDPTPLLEIPPGFVPGPEGGDWRRYGWDPGKCLVGVHCRADGPLAGPDLEAVRVGRVEAVKLMTTSRPENVDQLRKINPNMFLVARMHADFANRVVPAAEFARWMEGDMAPLYHKGVRYFEVHNEPNLSQEGWKRSWQDGREFGAWYLDVVARLKARFPGVKFGYPGLSPGGDVPGIRMNSNAFLSGSDDAIRRSDWVGWHCYWVDEASMRMAAAGRSWEEVRRRFPDKLVLITEFANPSERQDSRAKGRQYVQYYEALRDEPGIGAAFAFVLSASSGFTHETWRLEDGRLTDIPVEVGRRSF
jgi:murein DD-endopeptidase MepM/ murein hydrolase activator NlpD